MRYVLARAKEESFSRTYRNYVTDALRIITQNTAGTVEEGIYLPERFAELYAEPGEPEEEDARSCEEIVADMWKSLKGGTNDG